jgi:dTDP-4-dehydrorhamnose 3,5-epimerase
VKFLETKLKGACLVEPELRSDERGGFARVFCRREFQAHGLNPDLAQCNLSFNRLAGTLRGMHYQRAPHAEAKLVRCTAGAIYDVIVDLRPESSTFMKWAAAELSAENRRLLYVPEGCAHGYQALTDGAEVFYQVSAFYHPPSEGGLRWDDPAFGIRWPLPVAAISAKDASWPDWGPAA